MNTALRVGVLLLFALAAFGSAWYVAFRLRTTFGLQRQWPLRVLVVAALVGSFILMGLATKSADMVVGLLYVLGGYLFAGYLFLTLAFVLLHVIERAWHIPKARVGAVALLLAAGATLVGGMWANTFSVVETEIALPGLDRDVVAMQLSDTRRDRGLQPAARVLARTFQFQHVRSPCPREFANECSPVQLILPARDDDRRHAVADEVRERPCF